MPLKINRADMATGIINFSKKTSRIVEEISSVIAELTGNILGRKQYPVVESRLRKRILELGMNDFDDYLEYLNKNKNKETQYLISLLTTHHTFFFREFLHFEYLIQRLPTFISVARKRMDKTIYIWSAACSKGHEVYSLAMFFEYHLSLLAPDVKYKILGSDIDVESVEIARNGVYRISEIHKIPAHYLGDYFIQGTGDIADFVKVSKRLKEHCTFEVLNLLHLDRLLINQKFDIIFCRNIFIYFDTVKIKKISRQLFDRLNDEGLLFTGVSESLANLDLDIENYGKSIYGKKQEASRKISNEKSYSNINKDLKDSVPVVPNTIRVVCVDDSPIVLKILKKIFETLDGYVVVGTAENGNIAHEIVIKEKPDVVTLDIHMPECSGIEYLERYYNKDHPPVIMVTSVNRGDLDLSLKSLTLGAADFIEKPSFQDFTLVAEELQMKIHAAILNNILQGERKFKVDKMLANKKVIENVGDKCWCVFSALSDIEKVLASMSNLPRKFPPVIIIIHGDDEELKEFNNVFSHRGIEVSRLNVIDDINANTIYLTNDFSEVSTVLGKADKRFVSACFYSSWMKELNKSIAYTFRDHIALEECGSVAQKIVPLFRGDKVDIIPSTSFTYHMLDYFSGR